MRKEESENKKCADDLKQEKRPTRVSVFRRQSVRAARLPYPKKWLAETGTACKPMSERVALGGIVSALCIVLMFTTGVMPALYITAPMVAGMLMIILAEEVSVPWAWLTYTAVSLLSLLVAFDKEAALMFILFFGYYPVLRPNLERIRPFPLRLLVKLVMYNCFLLVDVLLTVYVLGLPTFEEYSRWMLITLAVFANILFLFYDALLSRMRWFYRAVFVKRILGKHRR